jgi:hypothetical protein
MDNVMLGLMSSAVFVAFYAFAIKLIRLSSLALTDTLLVFFPPRVFIAQPGEGKIPAGNLAKCSNPLIYFPFLLGWIIFSI